jgi:hypothetical protein
MRKLAILASLGAVIGFAGLAQAEGFGGRCMVKTESDYLTVDAFLAKMIDQGYKVRTLETKGGCAKIHAVDRNGREAELLVDLTSGDAARRND